MRKLAVFLTCALLFVAQAYAQTARNVTGKVTDDKGAPLVGVTVSAVGANRNALTDNSGSFSIQVTEKVKTLRMSYVGFDSKEVNINGKSTVSVSLSMEDKALNEVVVVGYGTQRKREITGSIAADRL